MILDRPRQLELVMIVVGIRRVLVRLVIAEHVIGQGVAALGLVVAARHQFPPRPLRATPFRAT